MANPNIVQFGSNKVWGIDVYDPQWPFLKGHLKELKDGGMTWICWKGTMGFGDSPQIFLEEINEEADQAGLIRMIYGWIDATAPLQGQMDRFQALIERYNPHAVAGDFEQWWASWTEFFDFLSGKIPGSSVRVLSPTLLSSFGRSYMTSLKAMGKPTFLYTAPWFVRGYVGNNLLGNRINLDLSESSVHRAFAGTGMPTPTFQAYSSYSLHSTAMLEWSGLNSKEWMAEYLLWEADYWAGNRSKLIMLTFEELNILLDDIPQTSLILSDIWTKRHLRQWGSNIVLPGISAVCRTDMNFFEGTREDLRILLKLEDEIPIERPTRMRMVVPNVRVRWSPEILSGNVVTTYVPNGAVVSLADIDEVQADGQNWMPVIVWVSRGPDGTVYGVPE